MDNCFLNNKVPLEHHIIIKNKFTKLKVNAKIATVFIVVFPYFQKRNEVINKTLTWYKQLETIFQQKECHKH